MTPLHISCANFFSPEQAEPQNRLFTPILPVVNWFPTWLTFGVTRTGLVFCPRFNRSGQSTIEFFILRIWYFLLKDFWRTKSLHRILLFDWKVWHILSQLSLILMCIIWKWMLNVCFVESKMIQWAILSFSVTLLRQFGLGSVSFSSRAGESFIIFNIGCDSISIFGNKMVLTITWFGLQFLLVWMIFCNRKIISSGGESGTSVTCSDKNYLLG